METWIIIASFAVFAIGFLAVTERIGGGISAKWREIADRGFKAARDGKPMSATDYLTDPPKKLDYGYIDFLERELKIAAYDPDRIAIEIETEAEEIAATLKIGMDEEDWREALTKYHGKSADEILRGIPYGIHGLIVQQAQARGARYDWVFDYRIFIIGEVARREVRDRQLDRRPIRKLGEAKFFAPDEAKPVDDLWADENLRNGVYGPRTAERIREYERGGLLRRIIDSDGNYSEIRSFGS